MVNEVVFVLKALKKVATNPSMRARPPAALPDTFARTAETLKNKVVSVAEDTTPHIVAEVEQRIQRWTQQNGMNRSRIPDFMHNDPHLLPPRSAGAYWAPLNEFHFMEKLSPEQLDEFVPHEAFHAYASNLRRAFADQFPEEFKQLENTVILDKIRRGETGTLLKAIEMDRPKSGMFSDKVLEHIQIPDNFDCNDKTRLGNLLEHFIVQYDNMIYRDHKFADPILTEAAKQKIRVEWLPFIKASDPEPVIQSITTHIASQLPQVIQARRNLLQELSQQPKKMVFMEAPVFSASERAHVADFFQYILENPEISINKPAWGVPQLMQTAKTKIRRELQPKLTDYTSQFRVGRNKQRRAPEEAAIKKLEDYLNAQLIRKEMLANGPILPRNERLASSTTLPLTETEKQLAKDSYTGYLSTIEGNIRLFGETADLKTGFKISNKTLFDYTLGAWEELRAREASSQFRLQNVTQQITTLEKMPYHPNRRQDLTAARALQVKIENDLALLTKTKEYLALEQEIVSAPRDSETLRQIRLCRRKLDAHKKKAFKLNQRVDALMGPESLYQRSAKVEKRPDGTILTIYSTTPELKNVLAERNVLQNVTDSLKERIERLQNTVLPSHQHLTDAQERVWQEMKDYAKNCTLNPLPPSLLRN